MNDCSCKDPHPRTRIVITGGPGAGKTAVLELVRRYFCRHTRVLPEAASIIFLGGFPRRDTLGGRRAVQRAIYYVQRELERELDDADPAAVLCDRGTIDGVAYWPGSEAELWEQLDTSRAAELGRYDAVIHLRTPPGATYNLSNPARIESALEARALDERILAAWADHPRRVIVESTEDFLQKAARTLELIRLALPECCRGHEIPALVGR